MPLNAEEFLYIQHLKNLSGIEHDRQVASDNRLLILNDDWKELVLERLKKLVSDETYNNVADFVNITVNPFKSIIEDISQVYALPPNRTFEGDEDKVEFWSTLYNELWFNEILKVSNGYMNALNETILYVVWRNGRPEVDVLTPNILTVLTADNDATKPEKFFIKRRYDPNKDYIPDNTYWIVWTEGEHYMLDKNIKVVPFPDNKNMINPWGILPFVTLHRKLPVDSYWNDTAGNDLYELAIIHGVKKLLDDFTRAYNSFKHPIVSGHLDEEPVGLVSSPDSILAFKGTDLNVVIADMQVALDKLNDDRKAAIAAVANVYGVDWHLYETEHEESGKAKDIKNKKLLGKQRTQEEIFLRAENELFNIMKRINSISTGKNPDADKTEMSLKFTEPEPYIDPKTKLDMDEKEIALDLKDKVDVFMERNQQYKGDRNAAEKRLLEIHESNQRFRDMRDASISEELNRIELEEKE